VKFIYFGISYDNPCSPLSLSLLPAPRSPLQAHVLATSLDITKNFLFIGFLANKGFKVEFSRLTCIISDQRGKLIATASRDPQNGLYRL
jgi:hypothetical protein